MLEPRSVLVTGATGFIGRRLVERLLERPGIRVGAVVRDAARARETLGPQVRLVQAVLSDAVAVRDALFAYDVVVHLAFDHADPDENLAGLRNLAGGSLAAAVKRLVYVSSAAVHEPLTGTILRECEPTHPAISAYADTKRSLERELVRYVAQGLSAVTLQPTIPYGPRSPTWTDMPVRQLLSGTLVLPEGGEGVANLLYVDDLCAAVELAMQAPGNVTGERFLISGQDQVTWGEFYSWYAELLGRPPPRLLAGSTPTGSSATLRRAAGKLLESQDRLLSGLVAKVPPRLQRAARQAAASARRVLPAPVFHPGPTIAPVYEARCTVRIDKARALLGFEPAFSFSRGRELTAEYVRRTYLTGPR